MSDQKKRWKDSWRVNPATSMLYEKHEYERRILKKNGFTPSSDTSEVSRITDNKHRIDNAIIGRQTSLGGISGEMLLSTLDIEHPWFVKSVTMGKYPKSPDHRENRILGEYQIELGVARGPYSCPRCGTLCRVHQYETVFYSHLRIERMACVLKVTVPKLRCDVCDGYPQVEVPWARPRASYTLAVEEEVFMYLDTDMPVADIASIMGMNATVLWKMILFRTRQALDRMDLSHVTTVYIDETSSKKGHNYVTVVCDQLGDVIFVCEGKGSDTVDRFCAWLTAHGGRPERIQYVSCDLGDAFPAGVRRNFPEAVVVYDRFHSVKLLMDPLDELTREEMEKHSVLKGMRRLLTKNRSDLSPEQERRIWNVLEDFDVLSMNYRLAHVFTTIYEYGDKEAAARVFELWYKEVQRHGCDGMKRAADSLWERREGILAWYDSPINNGYAEGINSLIQAAKRIARGFRNPEYFMAMIYVRTGNLKITFDRVPSVCPDSQTGSPGERSEPTESRFPSAY